MRFRHVIYLCILLLSLLVVADMISILRIDLAFPNVTTQKIAITTQLKTYYTNGATSSIKLLNREVGSITRICKASNIKIEDPDKTIKDGKADCTLPTGSGNGNINAPMPIHVKSWMIKNDVFKGYSTLLYYSSRDEEQNIHLLGGNGGANEDDQTMTWQKPNVNINLSNHPCKSLHNPSIIVNDKEEKFYMYIHGHQCSNVTNSSFQPTLLFTSENGIDWNHQMVDEEGKVENEGGTKNSYMFEDLFQLSVPVYLEKDGYYYVIAKTQKSEIGSAILCRSKSLNGPFEKGPVLGNGFRHANMHILRSNTDSPPVSSMVLPDQKEVIYVFFTMIGDSPEKILLSSIDTTESSSWMLWKLLPGPRILQPEYFYEHGNVTASPSTPSVAQETKHELHYPHFLPIAISESEDDGERKDNVIMGSLFYTVQGEKGIAMAKLVIDISLYYQEAISYRNSQNIAPDVYTSSSLNPEFERNANETVLVTGVGRSGTTFMCTFFQSVGIKVSHDNNVDCGKYPGPDGAVSWYDAFFLGRRYDRVLHIVRDPLKVILSRVKRKGSRAFFKSRFRHYEDLSFVNSFEFALKHWVRRNSFVQRHASWRVRTEMFYAEPLSVWETCMAAGFQERCPSLIDIRDAMDEIPSNLNTGKRKSDHNRDDKEPSWDDIVNSIGPETSKYVAIAQSMARTYGFEEYENATLVDFECKFEKEKEGKFENWDCFLI